MWHFGPLNVFAYYAFKICKSNELLALAVLAESTNTCTNCMQALPPVVSEYRMQAWPPTVTVGILQSPYFCCLHYVNVACLIISCMPHATCSNLSNFAHTQCVHCCLNVSMCSLFHITPLAVNIFLPQVLPLAKHTCAICQLQQLPTHWAYISIQKLHIGSLYPLQHLNSSWHECCTSSSQNNYLQGFCNQFLLQPPQGQFTYCLFQQLLESVLLTATNRCRKACSYLDVIF